MRKEIKRDILEDKSVQEMMLENDFLKYLNQVYSDLLKEHNISTNKLNTGKKHELSVRARRLCRESRKKLINIAAPRTVLYSWFKNEVRQIYDSSEKAIEKKKRGRPSIKPKTKQLII